MITFEEFLDQKLTEEEDTKAEFLAKMKKGKEKAEKEDDDDEEDDGEEDDDKK